MYITHRIQHNKLISFLFEIHVCFSNGQKKFCEVEKGKERDGWCGWNTYIFKFSSVYFISFGGIFLSNAILFQKESMYGIKSPFSIWPAKCCLLGKTLQYIQSRAEQKKPKKETKKIGKKTFFLFFLLSPRPLMPLT